MAKAPNSIQLTQCLHSPRLSLMRTVSWPVLLPCSFGPETLRTEFMDRDVHLAITASAPVPTSVINSSFYFFHQILYIEKAYSIAFSSQYLFM